MERLHGAASGGAPAWLTPRVVQHIRDLYGANTRYEAALIEFADQRGWTISTLRWNGCLDRLARPGHRCTSARCWPAWPATLLDHCVWLHRGDPRRPTRFAVLAQPYEAPNRDELRRILSATGASCTITPHAPYGHGTFAVLLVGRVQQAVAA